ncbi:MAG TPA: NADPH:quinone oxidoreductase family protein [Bryobacteraceae bacterium]|jgi:NADPH2:quinone reductase
MKAWQVTEWCEPEAIHWNDVPPPEPGAGQVRIRMRAAALNFFDILQIQGKYQVKPPFPFTPGAEVSGVIDAIGTGVENFALGDRVLAMPQLGAFSEQVIADANRTFPMPDDMSFEEAAAFPIVYQTSWCALVTRGSLAPGETLLVHAGASGVGMSAIQLGRALEANVIATASTQAKLDFALSLGATHAINYSDATWVDQVKSLTNGRGVDVIYDPVGGDIFDQSNKVIAPAGRHLVIGFASGRIPTLPANRALLKNMSLVGVFWGGWAASHPNYMQETHEALMGWYATGNIRPVVSSSNPLADLPAALRQLADRKVLGKAVVVVP